MSPGTPDASEFYPPRAAQTPWWRRRLRRLEVGLGGFTEALRGVRDPDAVAFASIVPGLGHLIVEQRPKKAAGLLGVFAALFVWTSLFSGAGIWWSTVALFSYHQWLFADSGAKARVNAGLPRRRGVGLVIFTLLTALSLAVVYRQAGRVFAHFGAAVCLESDLFEPRFKRGDRLLVLRANDYRRGDIVYSAAHGGLERVVGVAGDEITIQEGALRVNGRTLSLHEQPFSDGGILRRIGKANLLVPSGSYCVFFPSRSGWVAGERLLQFFLIPRAELDGRLALRYSPKLTRFP